MSRTRRYQLLYVLSGLPVVALAVLIYLLTGLAGLMVFAVLLLIPGRLGGYYLRNLFLSRKLFSQGRFEETIDAGRAFLADLQRQPWRRHLIYCHYGIYTWDVEAMVYNNSGAARMELGIIDQAERDLRFALQLDPDYPLPYFNLAVIAYVRDDTTEGDRLLSIAADKGFTGGPIDDLVLRVSVAFAHLQAPG